MLQPTSALFGLVVSIGVEESGLVYELIGVILGRLGMINTEYAPQACQDGLSILTPRDSPPKMSI